MCLGCTPTGRKFWSFGCGIVILSLSITLGLLWPTLSIKLINSELQLTEYTENYKNWIKSPFPLYMEFYFFNWTNWEEFNVEGENGRAAAWKNIKPKFEELGPYVFEEIHERVGVVYSNDNNEIEFNQTKTWWFREDLSKGSIDDKITSINPVSATIAYGVRHFDDPGIKFLMDSLLTQLGRMFQTATVKEWLFDGFQDGILDWLVELIESGELPPGLPIPEIPYEKFGWFALRNGSADYDGRFKMYTGKDDINKLGLLKSWNGKDTLGVMRGDCDKIEGTTGELWPPFDKKEKADATMFIPDVCRKLSLSYSDKFELHGIKGWKWIGDDRMFDNGNKYPETECFCTLENPDECKNIPPGIFNTSECNYGAPAFASFPHFYLGDKSYLDPIEGLSPDKNKHEMYISLEPQFGLPLEIRARLQINLFLKNDPFLTYYKDVPEIYVPMFWFTQIADLPKDLAEDAKMLYVIQDAGIWTSYGLAALGSLCIVLGIIFIFVKCGAQTQQPPNVIILKQT